ADRGGSRCGGRSRRTWSWHDGRCGGAVRASGGSLIPTLVLDVPPSGAVPPAQDPQRPEGHPPAREALTLPEVEQRGPLVDVLQRPQAARVRLAAEELDGVGQPSVATAGDPEVLEAAEHV